MCLCFRHRCIFFLENLQSQECNTLVILSTIPSAKSLTLSGYDFKLFANVSTKKILKSYAPQNICTLIFKFFINLTSYKTVISKILWTLAFLRNCYTTLKYSKELVLSSSSLTARNFITVPFSWKTNFHSSSPTVFDHNEISFYAWKYFIDHPISATKGYINWNI